MKKKPVIILISAWLLLNIIGLAFLWHTYTDYRDNEYIFEGRGSNAKVITKQEDPEKYAQRMFWFPTAFPALPLFTGLIVYLHCRQFLRKNEDSN